jgi:hypothetical protein
MGITRLGNIFYFMIMKDLGVNFYLLTRKVETFSAIFLCCGDIASLLVFAEDTNEWSKFPSKPVSLTSKSSKF